MSVGQFYQSIRRNIVSQNDNEENGRITIKEAFGKWFGLFLVLISAAVVYLLIINLDDIFSGITYIFGIVKPVIYGAIIAYLLNPLTKMYYRLLLKGYEKKGKKPSAKTVSVIESLTILFALLTGVLIIAILCWLVIPQLITTVISLIETVPSQANDYYNYLTEKIQSNKYIASRMQDTALKCAPSKFEFICKAVCKRCYKFSECIIQSFYRNDSCYLYIKWQESIYSTG